MGWGGLSLLVMSCRPPSYETQELNSHCIFFFILNHNGPILLSSTRLALLVTSLSVASANLAPATPHFGEHNTGQQELPFNPNRELKFLDSFLDKE